MQGHWANAAPYYRCRFPSEYALANSVRHPANVTLRQADVLGPLDGWLAGKFGQGHLDDTIDELAAAAALPSDADAGQDELKSKIVACDRKLAQHRAALDAGADPATVAGWITETEAARATFIALQRPARQQPQATRDEIAAIVRSLSDLHAVVRDASPADKAEIYKQLGLRLTYQPGQRVVQAQAALSAPPGRVPDHGTARAGRLTIANPARSSEEAEEGPPAQPKEPAQQAQAPPSPAKTRPRILGTSGATRAPWAPAVPPAHPGHQRCHPRTLGTSGATRAPWAPAVPPAASDTMGW
jgi:hypothetical protein